MSWIPLPLLWLYGRRLPGDYPRALMGHLTEGALGSPLSVFSEAIRVMFLPLEPSQWQNDVSILTALTSILSVPFSALLAALSP